MRHKIALLIFEGMTALDAVGPMEVLSAWPTSDIFGVAPKVGPLKSSTGLTFLADTPLSDLPDPDIVVVPGGPFPLAPLQSQETLEWLRSVYGGARWMTSVCTGSYILGAAGLLKGKKATTHWSAMAGLEAYGAIPTQARSIVAGDVITGAGVSAGIDMALALTATVLGEAAAKTIQLGIEYDPAPPFDTGHPDKAGDAIVKAYFGR